MGVRDEPFDIAPAADGNMWFTDQGTTKAIGRLGTGVPSAVQAPPAPRSLSFTILS